MCASRQAIIEHYKYDANLLLFDTVDPNLYQDVEKYSQDTCLVFDTDYIYKKKDLHEQNQCTVRYCKKQCTNIENKRREQNKLNTQRNSIALIALFSSKSKFKMTVGSNTVFKQVKTRT